jgi:hypothetical protein
LGQVRRQELWRARCVLGVLIVAAIVGGGGIVFGLLRAVQGNSAAATAPQSVVTPLGTTPPAAPPVERDSRSDVLSPTSVGPFPSLATRSKSRQRQQCTRPACFWSGLPPTDTPPTCRARSSVTRRYSVCGSVRSTRFPQPRRWRPSYTATVTATRGLRDKRLPVLSTIGTRSKQCNKARLKRG